MVYWELQLSNTTRQIKSALLYTGRCVHLGDLCLDFEICFEGSFLDFWGPVHIWKPPGMEAHIAQHWWTVPVHLQDLQIQCLKDHIYINIYVWRKRKIIAWWRILEKTKKGWKRLGSSRDAYSEVFSALWHSLQEWGEYFTVYLTNSVQLCLETEKSHGYSSRCWTHLRWPVQLSTPSLLWGKLRLVTCMNFHELLW